MRSKCLIKIDVIKYLALQRDFIGWRQMYRNHLAKPQAFRRKILACSNMSMASRECSNVSGQLRVIGTLSNVCGITGWQNELGLALLLPLHCSLAWCIYIVKHNEFCFHLCIIIKTFESIALSCSINIAINWGWKYHFWWKNNVCFQKL